MDHSRFQQQQVSSGLTRYRSAPSSYFASLLSSTPASVGVGGGIGGVGCGYARDDFDQLLDSRGSCTNLQQDLATFVASVGGQDSNLSNFGSNQKIQHHPTSNMDVGSDFVSLKRNDEAQLNNRHQKLARHRSSDYSSILQMNYLSQDQQSQFISSVKQEIENQQQHLQRQQSSDFSSGSHMNYQSQAQNSKFSSSVKQETETQQQQHGSDYPAVPQMNYQSQAQQNDNSRATSSAMDSSFRFSSSVRSDHLTPVTMESGVGAAGGNSNLTRYNSSPAGFFGSIDIDYEYGATRGFSNNASPRLMAPISEIGDKGMEESSAGDKIFGECNKNVESNITGFPMASWEDSLILSDDFLNVPEDSESQPFSNVNTSENQNSEGCARPLLSHHLSLPTSTMEKLLEDSVPMRSRAKRGCATHPRSIAERVRRTRISDRMRKLQELVPNMDKQTNTSDMLDLAVDYIKDLKKEVKILSEKRDKCVCTNK